jgi:putative DNA primase/helicase
LLNPEYGISHKPIEQGRKWVCGEIKRARAKQRPKGKPRDITNGTVGDDMEPVDDAPLVDKVPLSDVYNSMRLVRKFGASIRYCGEWEEYLTYDNGVWIRDRAKRVVEYAKVIASDMFKEARKRIEKAEEKAKVIDLVAKTAEAEEAEEAAKRAEAYYKHALKAHSAHSLRNMVELAKSAPPLPISYEALDTHHYLLPVENGVIDLKTGALLPHDPAYFFTRRMPVIFDPEAPCPNWKRALFTMMGGPITPDSPDDSAATLEVRYQQEMRANRLVRFLQSAIGCALTGDVREHMLVILWGVGRNGKGVISEVLLKLFGSLGTKATQELLMQNRFDSHPTERTDLFGRRLVITSESDKNRKLNLGFVKEATGGDTMKARRMRQDFWEFYPTHHIFLSTNHKPLIEEDDAIWERIYLVPFERKFENPDRLTEAQRQDPNTPIRDTQLKGKLLEELPGILNWALEGCLSWQRDGLCVPDEVLAATADYRKEEDVIGRFIEEECTVIDNDSVKVQPKDLFDAYKDWAVRTNETRERLTQRQFGDAMKKRGYVQDRTGQNRYWTGIGLAAKDRTNDKSDKGMTRE